MFYNIDCIGGAKIHLNDGSVDLIVTDPPYGINGDTLHKHYNRNENNVLDGYIEIPKEDYYNFSLAWIKEAERVLKVGGSMYIITGYTNLIDILNALKQTKLKEVNHLIWKYNFGVYTKNKYVSSHYHILYLVKIGAKPTFNTYCRFSDAEKENGKSLNYQDREDVFIINKEYKPNEVKNKNELPKELLEKLILYSSNENDLVCDFFLGGFSTARVAKTLNRQCCGFELNPHAFEHGLEQLNRTETGSKLTNVKKTNKYFNQGKPLTVQEKDIIKEKYLELKTDNKSKKHIINLLSELFGRGPFSLQKIIKEI